MRIHDTRTLWQVTFIGLLALMASGPAQAVDGVIEINQAKVKAGGGHFPFVIFQPGSYRLTGNLDVTDASARLGGTLAENTTAIQVQADHVTIDLNGFMITGPTVCGGSPFGCSPTGSGTGIFAGPRTGVAVMNGTVQGMGLDGVFLGSLSQAEKIRAVSNGNNGIVATTATACLASSNNSLGILAQTVASCTASNNGIVGIQAITVTGCTAQLNVGTGIIASTVANCTASNNGAGGISATMATGCSAYGNTPGQLSASGIAGQNICGPGFTPCP